LQPNVSGRAGIELPDLSAGAARFYSSAWRRRSSLIFSLRAFGFASRWVWASAGPVSWTEGIRKVQVWVELLQSSVQQDQFGSQFVPHIFWVDGVIAPQGPQQHRQDSRGKGRIRLKFSIFKCWNAEAAEL
jgi:hypothetical protein